MEKLKEFYKKQEEIRELQTTLKKWIAWENGSPLGDFTNKTITYKNLTYINDSFFSKINEWFKYNENYIDECLFYQKLYKLYFIKKKITKKHIKENMVYGWKFNNLIKDSQMAYSINWKGKNYYTFSRIKKDAVDKLYNEIKKEESKWLNIL